MAQRDFFTEAYTDEDWRRARLAFWRDEYRRLMAIAEEARNLDIERLADSAANMIEAYQRPPPGRQT